MIRGTVAGAAEPVEWFDPTGDSFLLQWWLTILRGISPVVAERKALNYRKSPLFFCEKAVENTMGTMLVAELGKGIYLLQIRGG